MKTGDNQLSPERTPEIDALLRGALEPDQATVDRLVNAALIERDPRSARWRWWPNVATHRWQRLVAATALLAAIALPILWPRTAKGPATVQAPQEMSIPAQSTVPGAPAVLRISNEEGPVTVTTPAGSKMVVLSSILDSPASGDAS